jgi:lysyl endopeptidase
MRAIFLLILFTLLISINGRAQLFQKGFPMEILHVKSNDIPVVKMPSLNNLKLKKSAIDKQNNSPILKPFKFAHAFDVNLTTENSGKWYKTNNGYHCWKLKINSEKAKSLYLVFDKFKLPENARLFLYNENYTLGAFTSVNNKSSEKFAVSPIPGDEITIQYEVPSNLVTNNNFEIINVYHDYVGITAYNDRRPRGEVAGECNIDINCEIGGDWYEVKNSVCRIITDGEICSGTLINNTAENQLPYVLSAAHCYDSWDLAEVSIYVFNYESPYCGPLDGDPSNSISGAIMKAQFDSLDFALAELSLVPPPEFRPYFAGWDRSADLSASSTSIHHPQGDIKKIALDYDSPVISDFNSDYLQDAFLKIIQWDEGVTEVGSSGGPLFNPDKNLIGTLTGGVATCNNPVRDYFARFSLSWDYLPDSSKQLKYWLDPLALNTEVLNGKEFYEKEELCGAFTNLNDNDSHELIVLTSSEEFAGYWGGTNNVGITEFVEKFSIEGNEQLSGISLGVGKIEKEQISTESEISIKVYNGTDLPQELIYSKKVLVNNLVEDAMNFIDFDEIIEPEDTFFVGFELSNMQPLDTFVVYQSLRPANTDNYFYFKKDGAWQSFENANLGYNSVVNAFELLACNLDDTISVPPKIELPTEIKVYPNPTQDRITFEANSEIQPGNIDVFNLIGKKVEVSISNIDIYRLEINLSGNTPGIYFVRFNTGEKYVTKKISFVPW